MATVRRFLLLIVASVVLVAPFMPGIVAVTSATANSAYCVECARNPSPGGVSLNGSAYGEYRAWVAPDLTVRANLNGGPEVSLGGVVPGGALDVSIVQFDRKVYVLARGTAGIYERHATPGSLNFSPWRRFGD